MRIAKSNFSLFIAPQTLNCVFLRKHLHNTIYRVTIQRTRNASRPKPVKITGLGREAFLNTSLTTAWETEYKALNGLGVSMAFLKNEVMGMDSMPLLA